MQSFWNDAEAKALQDNAGTDPAERDLALRVYTSRLIGNEIDLVLHGGGNTSVKVERNSDQVLHVKGSGWDLATIEAPGLPGLLLEPLLDARKGGRLSDPDMVALLRSQMLDKSGPNPSVETLLHAFLPFKFVDHTHSAAALVIADQPNAAELARDIFGDRLAIVPYVMPGFDLAIEAADCFDKAGESEGLFLVNHGLFSYHEDAKTSYENILAFTTACEDFLARNGAPLRSPENSLPIVADRRAALSNLEGALQDYDIFKGGAFLEARNNPGIEEFLALPDLEEVSCRGTITPDHVIRLKQKPLIGSANYTLSDWQHALEAYVADYTAYFERHAPNASEPKTMLDPLPRSVLIKGLGIAGISRDQKEARICADLVEQGARVIVAAEKLGRFTPIGERELFDMEYWSLEQAKLKAG